MSAIEPSTITVLVKIGTGVLIVLIAHLIHRVGGRYTYTEVRPGPDDPVVFEEVTPPADTAGEAAAVTDPVAPAMITDTQPMTDAEEKRA
jgi:hypothetical protein